MSDTVKVSDYICSRILDLTGSRHVFLLSGGGFATSGPGTTHLIDALAARLAAGHLQPRERLARQLAARLP